MAALDAVDRVTVTTVVDNYIDSLRRVLALGISVMGSVTAWAVHKSDWGR